MNSKIIIIIITVVTTYIVFLVFLAPTQNMDYDLKIILTINAVIGTMIGVFALLHSVGTSLHQKKISSAQLILKLQEPWQTPDFKQFLERWDAPYPLEDVEIEMFVDRLEDAATCWNNKAITNNDLEEFFGSTFKLVKSNKQIFDFIMEADYKNTKKIFQKFNF